MVEINRDIKVFNALNKANIYKVQPDFEKNVGLAIGKSEVKEEVE